MKVDTSLKAEIIVVAGASGSGKSSIVKDKIAKHKRLVVFDPDDEYGEIKGIKKAENCQQLLQMLKDTKGGALKVRIVAQSKAAFDFVSLAVFAWGNCGYVAEELGGRSTPGKAQGGWHTVVSRGRKRGISIYGVGQRVAESDKTILGNASEIYCGRLTRFADRKLISQEIDISVELIGKLRDLQFIRADMATGGRFAYCVKDQKEQKIPV